MLCRTRTRTHAHAQALAFRKVPAHYLPSSCTQSTTSQLVHAITHLHSARSATSRPVYAPPCLRLQKLTHVSASARNTPPLPASGPHLHLNGVALLQRAVEQAGRVNDLPAQVAVVHVPHKQRLRRERVWLHVHVRARYLCGPHAPLSLTGIFDTVASAWRSGLNATQAPNLAALIYGCTTVFALVRTLSHA